MITHGVINWMRVMNMKKYFTSGLKFFQRHPAFNGTTHALGGIGIGMLLTYPVAGNHPVRWALSFLALGLAGHIWAMTHKA